MSTPRTRRIGDYVLLEELGHGAEANVFLAHCSNRERGLPPIVVIKLLHAHLREHESYIQRFRHQAELAVCVDSPNVAHVFDVGEAGDELFITMEYAPGWPLGKIFAALSKVSRLPPVEAAVDLIVQTLTGVHALHTAVHQRTSGPLRAIHRDLAPKNVIISPDGAVKIIDLGLGKSNLQEWKTIAGAVMGTPGYMSPEQALGEASDHRSDLYQVGILFFEMLTVDRYLPDTDFLAALAAAAQPRQRSVLDHRRDLPPEIVRISDSMLTADPERRPESAAAVIAALSRVVPEAKWRGALGRLVDELIRSALEPTSSKMETMLASVPVDLPEPADLTDPVDRTEPIDRTDPLIDRTDPIGRVPPRDPAEQTVPTLIYATRPTMPMVEPRDTLLPRTRVVRGGSRGIPPAVVVALALLIGAIGVIVGRKTAPAPPTAVSVEEPNAPETPVKVEPRVVRTEPEPEPDPDPDPDPMRTVTARKRRPAPAKGPEPTPAHDEPTKERVQARIRALTARGASAKHRDTAAGAEIDQILGDAAMWSESTEYAEAWRALTQLEERMKKIESR